MLYSNICMVLFLFGKKMTNQRFSCCQQLSQKTCMYKSLSIGNPRKTKGTKKREKKVTLQKSAELLALSLIYLIIQWQFGKQDPL